MSIDTAEKSALKYDNLSLKVVRAKRAKMLLPEVAKFHRRLYSGGRNFSLHPPPPPPLHHTNVSTELYLRQLLIKQITFKLGDFTNSKTFFPVVLTDFCRLVPVKNWKSHGRTSS